MCCMMTCALVPYDLDEGYEMLVLSHQRSADGTARTFIDKLIDSPRTEERLDRITKMARRVAEYGIDWAFSSGKLKLLENDLALYELKVGNTTIRVMTYLHEKQTPVYLFDFTGHKGKTGSISKNDMEKGRQLAKEARQCLERKGSKDE